MSNLSEQNRAAIFQRLAADTPLSAMVTGGVHFLVAPPGTEGAYLILLRISASINYALGNNAVYESDLWLLKAVVPSDLINNKGASEFAEEILSRCEAALTAPLVLSSGISLLVRREREMPPFAEQLIDVAMHHHGMYIRAITNV